MRFSIFVNVAHYISLTEHILSRCQHSLSVFRKIFVHQFCDTQFLGHLLGHIRNTAILNAGIDRHGLLQVNFIVIPIRDQLPGFLIQPSDRCPVTGWFPLLVPVGCSHIIHICLSGHLLIGYPVLGKLHLYISIQRHLKPFFLVMYSLIISHMQ